MMIIQKPLASIFPEAVPAFGDIMLSGLCADSRHVQAGELFFALSGADFNGCDYIDHAIDQGAAVIVVEKSAQWSESETYRSTPIIVIENLQSKLSNYAMQYYAYDRAALSVVGITGTNAKTSCSAYIQQLLNTMDQRCGVVGTLGWGVGENLTYTGNTTPSNLLLHRILCQLAEEKTPYAAIEVSSHGLELGRVENVIFKVAVLTNISRDHLDFHGDMASYVAAKKKLFQMQGVECAVINLDDDYAESFIEALSDDVKVLTYGYAPKADVRIDNFKSSLQGMAADFHYKNEIFSVQSSLLGDFNIYNLAASFATLLALDFSAEAIAKNISQVVAVKGRMENVANNLNITVLVDFAHTPDGLESVLKTLKAYEANNLWCVFGCGGDRDKGKRALMGEIAGRYADKIVITSDNPRSENPEKIIDEIAQACVNDQAIQIVDRRQAIEYTLQHAKAGDCVLIAGKGHEDYQETQGERIFFSDVVVAQEVLAWRAQQGVAS